MLAIIGETTKSFFATEIETIGGRKKFQSQMQMLKQPAFEKEKASKIDEIVDVKAANI